MSNTIAKRIKAARNRTFNVDIATEYGVNAAIFLGQLDYWLQHMGKEIDGEVWIYSTFENWISPANFPFWSEKTVKRIVADLRNKGLVITTGSHNKMPMDKTLWYAIPGWTEQRDIVSRPSGQLDPTTSGQLDPTNNHKNNHKITIKPAAPEGMTDKQSTDSAQTLIAQVFDRLADEWMTVNITQQETHTALAERYGFEAWLRGFTATPRGKRSNAAYVEKVIISELDKAEQQQPEQPKKRVKIEMQDGVAVAVAA